MLLCGMNIPVFLQVFNRLTLKDTLWVFWYSFKTIPLFTEQVYGQGQPPAYLITVSVFHSEYPEQHIILKHIYVSDG